MRRVTLLLCMLAGCGGDDDGSSPQTDGGAPPATDDTPLLPDPAPPPASSYGTIAYVRGGELRTIEPDGSGDRLVWAAPAVAGGAYTLSGPAWRPDGGEIAFASDHEAAISPYDTDIYAIRGDGINLRKITHAPTHDRFAQYPKGTVTLLVEIGAAGSYFVYVEGASEPIEVSANGRVTFQDVADLGGALQMVTATNGRDRWPGTPVDVQAGRSVEAGLLIITPFSGIPGYGATAPFWRSDGTKLGFLGPGCQPSQLPVAPAAASAGDPILAEDAGRGLCALDWGPTAQTANRLAFATTFDVEGQTFFYVATEGAAALPPPIATVDRYRRLSDLHWHPSGASFVVALQDDLLDEDMNLQLIDAVTGEMRQLTDFAFEGERLRRFTMSPDGATIVIERTDDLLFGDSSLWIANSDGSGLRMLVPAGAFPAWNPTAP